MKQILIQLDDRTASRLDEVAPGRSHKRSAFVRAAIQRALDAALETRTRQAYERWPDEPPAFDAREWAPEDEALRANAVPKRAARTRRAR